MTPWHVRVWGNNNRDHGISLGLALFAQSVNRLTTSVCNRNKAGNYARLTGLALTWRWYDYYAQTGIEIIMAGCLGESFYYIVIYVVIPS